MPIFPAPVKPQCSEGRAEAAQGPGKNRDQPVKWLESLTIRLCSTISRPGSDGAPLVILIDTDLAPKADAYDYCTRRAR